MIGLNSRNLRKVARDRGFITSDALYKEIGKVLNLSPASAEKRVTRAISLRLEEVLLIAARFEMTPKEFASCFLDGLFQESREGHFIARVDNPAELINR